MPMKNPPHPGRSIRTACLEPLGLSVTEGAEVLGVTRQTLNNVIHGNSGISPQMAIRLSKAFGSTPETWLRMQLSYDLARAGKTKAKSRSAVSMGCRKYRHSNGSRPLLEEREKWRTPVISVKVQRQTPTCL